MSETPAWLITGCSTGFGRELVRAATRRGHRVLATARDPSTLAEFASDPLVATTALDVTVPAQIAAAVALAEARFGGVGVVVNNAGYGYLAALEEGDEAEVRAMFETNVFGLVAVTRAVLPGMRARRRGHVVNISSMGGLVGYAGIGYYNATKFAVEGLSEALAKEVKPLGIRVTVVEPGPFRTDWGGRSLRVPATAIADYAETAGARRAMVQGYSGQQPGDPVRAARAIVAAVESPAPPLHLVLGRVAYDQVTEKLDELSREIAAGRETALAADFPDV